MLTPVREGPSGGPASTLPMTGLWSTRCRCARETGVVFVDPPMIHGLLDGAGMLGKLKAVLLTAQNHTKAARFIAKRAGEL